MLHAIGCVQRVLTERMEAVEPGSQHIKAKLEATPEKKPTEGERGTHKLLESERGTHKPTESEHKPTESEPETHKPFKGTAAPLSLKKEQTTLRHEETIPFKQHETFEVLQFALFTWCTGCS